jgi:DNA-binding PadR family transcriptional regulator
VSERKVSNPLALAVLSCLSERAMHPYEIAATLRERHKDDAIKLNYGSLYSVIEALSRNRFIEPKEKVKEGKRPERTIYQLTEAGSLELSDWLSELLSVPAKEFTRFEAGLSLMPALSPDAVVALLERRCDMLELGLANARSILSYTHGKKLPRLFVIDREYRIALLEAELAWVRSVTAEIASGKLEGSDEWRSWHTPARESEPKPDEPRA